MEYENTYSNGLATSEPYFVLILVLMEYENTESHHVDSVYMTVLILVLMEYENTEIRNYKGFVFNPS